MIRSDSKLYYTSRYTGSGSNAKMIKRPFSIPDGMKYKPLEVFAEDEYFTVLDRETGKVVILDKVNIRLHLDLSKAEKKDSCSFKLCMSDSICHPIALSLQPPKNTKNQDIVGLVSIQPSTVDKASACTIGWNVVSEDQAVWEVDIQGPAKEFATVQNRFTFMKEYEQIVKNDDVVVDIEAIKDSPVFMLKVDSGDHYLLADDYKSRLYLDTAFISNKGIVENCQFVEQDDATIMDVRCNMIGTAGWIKRYYRSKSLAIYPGISYITSEEYQKHYDKVITVGQYQTMVLRLDKSLKKLKITDNSRAQGLAIDDVELFSAVPDQQCLFIITKPSN